MNPLEFIKAANAKSKQRRAETSSLIAAATTSGVAGAGITSMANGAYDAPAPMSSSNVPLPRQANGKFLMPFAGKVPINSDFGPRIHPIKGTKGIHTGIDYGAGAGKPIYAIGNGVVRKATPNGGAYGNQVVVDLGGGLESMYGHLSRFTVQPGQRVRKGQVIGYVGNTGLSTGPHLHFETRYRGKPVDPEKFLG